MKAREEGLVGATMMRGMMGFGAHSRMHTFKIERLSQDLPIIIEILTRARSWKNFFPSSTTKLKKAWRRWRMYRFIFIGAGRRGISPTVREGSSD